jgi:hypothetical protein
MKLGIRNKWTSPRLWVWWTVLPVFLLLAATAQAGDFPDPGIGPSAGTGASRPEGVGTSMAGARATVAGADLSPEASISGAQLAAPRATGEGANPGPQPVGIPAPEPPPASIEGAAPGADPGGPLKGALQGPGATTNVSDSRMMVARQLAETIGPTLKAIRATAFAAIDYLRGQLVGAIRRINPPLPSTPPEHESPPEAIPEWTTTPDASTSASAGTIEPKRGELSPASGGTRSAPEASSDQLATPGITAGAKPPQSEHPISPSASHGPASGLGSATQILISLGLAAAACGFAAPAMCRRFVSRAGWLRSALLASSLEQPG